MPCRDWEPAGSGVPQETYDAVRADLTRLKKRLDRATRVACELSDNLNVEEQSRLSKEAQEWISEHRAADAKRKHEEQERIRRDEEEKSRKAKLERDRKAALLKLSKEERRVLGLPDPA